MGLLAIPGLAAAQELPRRVIEVSGGFAGFVDESIIQHGALGAAVRWDLARHLSVGPEFVYMAGGLGDQDMFLTGKVVVDFLRDAGRLAVFRRRWRFAGQPPDVLPVRRLLVSRGGGQLRRRGANQRQPPGLRRAGSADRLGAAYPFHRDGRLADVTRLRACALPPSPRLRRTRRRGRRRTGARRDDNFGSHLPTLKANSPPTTKSGDFTG